MTESTTTRRDEKTQHPLALSHAALLGLSITTNHHAIIH